MNKKIIFVVVVIVLIITLIGVYAIYWSNTHTQEKGLKGLISLVKTNGNTQNKIAMKMEVLQ